MADIGIKISSPNVDARDASNNELLLSSKYPYLKLDTQSTTSFQTVTLLFNNDPPEPGGTGTKTTTVYSFAHNLGYTPRVWALFQTVITPTGAAFHQDYFQDAGIIDQQTVNDQAALYITSDSTNISIKVDKSNFGGGSPNNLIGSSFKFTIFTFIDDIT